MNHERLHYLLHEAYLQELDDMLPLNAFSGSVRSQRRICDALAHPGLKKYQVSSSFLSDTGTHFYADPATCFLLWNSMQNFRVALPPALAGAHAIFSSLGEYGLHVETDYHFSHSAEIIHRMKGGEFEDGFDACVLAFAVAAAEGLLSAHSSAWYKPLMLMPQTSHRILASGTSQAWEGDYHFITEHPGTGAVYFEELTATRQLSRARSRVTHAEPHGLRGVMKSQPEDMRAIVWFPHYCLLAESCSAKVIDSKKDSLAHQGTVLFVHERILRDLALSGVIKLTVRRAWAELLSNRSLSQRIVKDLLAEAAYRSYLAERGGIFVYDDLSQRADARPVL